MDFPDPPAPASTAISPAASTECRGCTFIVQVVFHGIVPKNGFGFALIPEFGNLPWTRRLLGDEGVPQNGSDC